MRGRWHTAGVQSLMFLSSSADSRMPLGNRRLPTREGKGEEGKGGLLPCSCRVSRGSARPALGQLPAVRGDRQTLTRFLSCFHIRTKGLQASGLRK